ncbi:NaeI family type II restriction endonuclease [Pseudoalteromonas sp. SG44-8]|uniref:NaeI family type II restriction endonuclease n=1 Tax=Pseudoalteromonas sp. SG44-8 TaxID=2760958 RepID=UPI001602EE72|nr:NaeI family type II restriction endonuclease [Pseudoalteromonas sp. SG44-8]MBB1396479.1 hypothetical protein [Pseudoalteromonas sp. SG44-8]
MLSLNEKSYLEGYLANYPDNSILKNIYSFFVSFPNDDSDLEVIIGDILRSSLDEVIDMPRTNRFSLQELEKTEKTYIGTKVEIVFRDTFLLNKGKKLDLLVEGKEVDVKNTIGTNWTIPSEAVDEICVLLQTNDDKSSFCIGLIICRDRVLNQGRNRDGKRTISKSGKNEILWLVENGKLPKNFFLHMDEGLREEVLQPKGGATRLANLFRSFQNEIITRRLVECVARQKDYMKRIRGNGGARDILAPEELMILWGGNLEDKEKLKSLGFKGLTKEHFVCIKKS